HILAEVEALCDRVVILARGRVVADEAVALATPAHDVLAEWEAAVDRVRGLIDGVRAARPPDAIKVAEIKEQGSTTWVKISCQNNEIADAVRIALGHASARQQLALIRLELGRRSLEERFARVTGAVEDSPHAR
ncbi:MAG: hypothetical protein KC486_20370, partial [Myxococcales bacterium]|nr:hypothetical protein [Myxococcales bacterium]